MLAHLAYAELRAPWRKALLLLGAAVAAGFARTASAADLTPPVALDANASGHVSDGQTTPVGDVTATLRIDDASGVASSADVGMGTGNGTLVNRVDQASLLFGVGLAQRLDLTLGLHGTSETVGDRSGLAPAGAASPQAVGFSEASLLVKAQLVRTPEFQLALAPFGESGAGSDAQASVSRAANPRGGVLAIVSYGSPDLAVISANGGLRYHAPETIGDVSLMNEQFWSAGVETRATHDLSLFLNYAGRRIQVETADEPGASYVYHASSTVEAGAGLRIGDDAELQVYGAKGLQTDDFGYGSYGFGVSLAWTVGNYEGRPRHSFVDDVDTTQAEAKPAAAAAAQAAKAPPSPTKAALATPAAAGQEQENAPVDSLGATVDPDQALGGKTPDDFTEAEAAANQYVKDTQTESEDARIERELKAFHEADAKAEAERARIDEQEAAKRQAEAREQATQRDALERQQEEEAQKSVNQLQGITNDEMSWEGLQGE